MPPSDAHGSGLRSHTGGRGALAAPHARHGRELRGSLGTEGQRRLHSCGPDACPCRCPEAPAPTSRRWGRGSHTVSSGPSGTQPAGLSTVSPLGSGTAPSGAGGFRLDTPLGRHGIGWTGHSRHPALASHRALTPGKHRPTGCTARQVVGAGHGLLSPYLGFPGITAGESKSYF